MCCYIKFIFLPFIINLQILYQTLPARRCLSLLVLLIFPRAQIRPNHLGRRLDPSLTLASWAGWQPRQTTLVVILFVLLWVFSFLFAFPVLLVFWFYHSKLSSFVFYPLVHFVMALVWQLRPWWILQQRPASLLVLGQRKRMCPTTYGNSETTPKQLFKQRKNLQILQRPPSFHDRPILIQASWEDAINQNS